MDLLALSGSFWNDVNPNSLFSAVIEARIEVEKQTNEDMKILQACIGRETTPVHRNVLVQPLTISDGSLEEWQLPANLINVGIITNKLIFPDVVLFNNIDYKIENSFIKFKINPFITNLFTTNDNSIILWLFNSEYDERYLSDIWGSPVNVVTTSSTLYRELLCIIYKTLISGTSREHIENIISIFNGGVLAKEEETVNVITADTDGLLVITDRNVYRPTSEKAKILVSVNDKLQPGTAIFDTCTFYKPTEHIKFHEMPYLHIPKAFLNHQITGDLKFPNQIVPVIKKENQVRFMIDGEESGIEKFWCYVDNTKFVDMFKDLEVINPCDFVLKNVLRQNILICVIRNAVIPKELAVLDQSQILRTIMPPHEALLMINL